MAPSCEVCVCVCVWCSIPASSPAGKDILTHYMKRRKCHIPLSPDIDLNKLASTILAAGDSAAG
eukprot:14505429-Heterocapsa_arctica.AAC.1